MNFNVLTFVYSSKDFVTDSLSNAEPGELGEFKNFHKHFSFQFSSLCTWKTESPTLSPSVSPVSLWNFDQYLSIHWVSILLYLCNWKTESPTVSPSVSPVSLRNFDQYLSILEFQISYLCTWKTVSPTISPSGSPVSGWFALELSCPNTFSHHLQATSPSEQPSQEPSLEPSEAPSESLQPTAA